jgi:GNAT superfamily N-acetyltransferase
MDFTVTFERTNQVTYDFDGDQFKAVGDSEEEPVPIVGKVFIDDDKIGQLLLYELYNDTDFFVQCDALHSDFAVIAAAICGKSGAVLKKYVPDISQYESIYILDNITINKEYRGHGIGSAIVKNLLKMITYQFGDASVLFLCASDFESAKEYGFDSREYKAGTQRLIKFYSKLGFRVIKDNIMAFHKTRN